MGKYSLADLIALRDTLENVLSFRIGPFKREVYSDNLPDVEINKIKRNIIEWDEEHKYEILAMEKVEKEIKEHIKEYVTFNPPKE